MTWECAPPQGLRFDSLWCQFEGVSLASSKKKKPNMQPSRFTYWSSILYALCSAFKIVFGAVFWTEFWCALWSAFWSVLWSASELLLMLIWSHFQTLWSSYQVILNWTGSASEVLFSSASFDSLIINMIFISFIYIPYKKKIFFFHLEKIFFKHQVYFIKLFYQTVSSFFLSNPKYEN